MYFIESYHSKRPSGQWNIFEDHFGAKMFNTLQDAQAKIFLLSGARGMIIRILEKETVLATQSPYNTQVNLFVRYGYIIRDSSEPPCMFWEGRRAI